MAIKPIGRKSSSKNPPILSHEFVIQNHADIVSCIAMVFVVGLMIQTTSQLASVFVTLHHNVTGEEASAENPRGVPFFYEAGWKDFCAVFFYMLICIIMHAILQEYVLDKISKKLHLSKFKLSRFNESGQLVVFYLVSFLWGFEVMLREQYLSRLSSLWEDYPDHPMTFLHKLYFIIQLAYYLHMLPELYFQKVKKEDQREKIRHSTTGLFFVSFAYGTSFQRISVVLLTFHYFSEVITHFFQLLEIFDKHEKMANARVLSNIVFVFMRFSTMVLSVLTFFYGIGTTELGHYGILALFVVYSLQGYLIFQFINEFLRNRREKQAELKALKKTKPAKVDKAKKEKKADSDVPEVEQNSGKVKTK
ncbi:translocating chain-associated membrane protein 1 [Phlebotomus argentipes]|uniref:translocating chain-associated membrane protein 1 n=1 Tax=Phlebotomus argentipes TaxID=94469 RepID=UPI0028934996|nr:translocating chain-associated membrane protein 1 [Phlebotomus argentipes]